jgi:hypothetical protein
MPGQRAIHCNRSTHGDFFYSFGGRKAVAGGASCLDASQQSSSYMRRHSNRIAIDINNRDSRGL